MKREDIAKIFEGATDEQINAVLDINSKDIGSAKKKLEIERDKYKDQLETAQNSLKEFEGVDVNELQSKIKTLTLDLETKDTEYQQKIADMEFNSVLDSAISKSGAKNAKAVKALLDLENLKTSKNQADDITKALDEIKKDNDYMFTSDEPFKNPVRETNKPNKTKTVIDRFID
ncbi:MAG: phage scaffolding protein [Ruminococcus sp.]